MSFQLPVQSRLRWQKQHRIISSRYPPIDLFERLDLDETAKRALWALQARVNPRLRQQSGDLQRVRPEDMLSGPNASVVMAAFTHSGFPSRFSDGAFGIYYAARTLQTAVHETVFHRQRDAVERTLLPQEFDMRAYIGQVKKPLYDVRGEDYAPLHDPDPANYPLAQQFARRLLQHEPDAWGIVFNSVRHKGGDCIAVLRPPAVSLPVSGPHLTYVWNGTRITSVYQKSEPLLEFE
ncbi:MAG: RES family NAD+ phosphorylase [Gammaproteobacteria bacterium]|nr:RES family NAD+ phosphorylase [Gammaproteobacteria bacterium]